MLTAVYFINYPASFNTCTSNMSHASVTDNLYYVNCNNWLCLLYTLKAPSDKIETYFSVVLCREVILL